MLFPGRIGDQPKVIHDGTFIGLPDFAKSHFLSSKRSFWPILDNSGRFESRKSDFAKSGKPMNIVYDLYNKEYSLSNAQVLRYIHEGISMRV
jgi:hypothetical protein